MFYFSFFCCKKLKFSSQKRFIFFDYCKNALSYFSLKENAFFKSCYVFYLIIFFLFFSKLFVSHQIEIKRTVRNNSISPCNFPTFSFSSCLFSALNNDCSKLFWKSLFLFPQKKENFRLKLFPHTPFSVFISKNCLQTSFYPSSFRSFFPHLSYISAFLAKNSFAFLPSNYDFRCKSHFTQKPFKNSLHTIFSNKCVDEVKSNLEIDGLYEKLDLPSHPFIFRNRIKANDFSYVILSNSFPANRFDAYLEVHCGSTDELENQQGIAHMCEHIYYMGSRHREAILRKNVQTNAFTDFHHTVFYASCPLYDCEDDLGDLYNNAGQNERISDKDVYAKNKLFMLPLALRALHDVLLGKDQVTQSRLSKERSAILSEASMVNTAEYRNECKILNALHKNNRISKRFPIGKLEQIKSFTVSDIKNFHDTHYRPDNSVLYLIGDFPIEIADFHVQKVFSDLKNFNKFYRNSTYFNLYKNTEKTNSIYFPPVIHNWAASSNCGEQIDEFVEVNEKQKTDRRELLLKTEKERKSSKCAEVTKECAKQYTAENVHVWQHDLVKNFSVSFLIKRKMKKMRNLANLKEFVCNKIALHALSARLSIFSRGKSNINMLEVSSSDSVREACNIISLDLMTQSPLLWRTAIRKALHQIRFLALKGIEERELKSVINAYKKDIERIDENKISNSEYVRGLMDCLACGHTVMYVQQEKIVTLDILNSLTLNDINRTIYNLLRHFVPDEPQDADVNKNAQTNLNTTKSHISLAKRENNEDSDVFLRTVVASVPMKCSLNNEDHEFHANFSTNTETSHENLDRFYNDYENFLKQNNIFTEDQQPLCNAKQTRNLNREDELIQTINITKTDLLHSINSALNESLILSQNTFFAPNRLIENPKFTILNEKDSIKNVLNAKYENFDKLVLEKESANYEKLKQNLYENETLYFNKNLDIRMRFLKNKIKVNYKFFKSAKNSILVRLLIPGGRMEEVKGFNEGVSILGGRTMMEGGAVGKYKREEIEMFCNDHLINVFIDTSDEHMMIDIASHSRDFREAQKSSEGENFHSYRGAHNVFQLINLILTDFKFEEDALSRAKVQSLSEYEHYTRDLQVFTVGSTIKAMTLGDFRFGCLKPSKINQITLKQIEKHMRNELSTNNIEVNVVSDIEHDVIDTLLYTYLSYIPPSKKIDLSLKEKRDKLLFSTAYKDKDFPGIKKVSNFTNVEKIVSQSNLKDMYNEDFEFSNVKRLDKKVDISTTYDNDEAFIQKNNMFILKHLQDVEFLKTLNRHVVSYITDSEERAIVNICGYTTNKFGYLPDGTHIVSKMNEYSLNQLKAKRNLSQEEEKIFMQSLLYRQHPVFARTALAIMQDLINKRMFTVLREEKQLTYDAAFELMGFERIHGGIYILNVHTSPNNAHYVAQHAQQALLDLKHNRKVDENNVANARSTLLLKHRNEINHNPSYWIDLIQALQLKQNPNKCIALIEDMEDVIMSVTREDVDALINSIGFHHDAMWTSIGLTRTK